MGINSLLTLGAKSKKWKICENRLIWAFKNIIVLTNYWRWAPFLNTSFSFFLNSFFYGEDLFLKKNIALVGNRNKIPIDFGRQIEENGKYVKIV